MSEFRIDQIKSQDATRGPDVAGITTFTGTSGIVMPFGGTAARNSTYDGDYIGGDNLYLWLSGDNYDGGTQWKDKTDNDRHFDLYSRYGSNHVLTEFTQTQLDNVKALRFGRYNGATNDSGGYNYYAQKQMSGTRFSNPASGNFTIQYWTYFLSGRYVISSGGQTGSRGFTMHDNGEGSNPPDYFVSVKDGTNQYSSRYNDDRLGKGWVNHALVWNNDGSSLQEKLKYFQNGVIQATTIVSSDSQTDAQTLWTIGVPNNNKTNDYAGEFWMSDLKAYDRALSEYEVGVNYNGLRAKHGV